MAGKILLIIFMSTFLYNHTLRGSSNCQTISLQFNPHFKL
jgi:hypothetical protein